MLKTMYRIIYKLTIVYCILHTVYYLFLASETLFYGKCATLRYHMTKFVISPFRILEIKRVFIKFYVKILQLLLVKKEMLVDRF